MFKKLTIAAITIPASLIFGLLSSAMAQDSTSASYAAVQGQTGGQDMFGAYDVAADWPKDISTLPGADGWTFGAGQSVFAESPDRVFYLQRGLLPQMEAPSNRRVPEIGPSLTFPPTGIWRNATRVSIPGSGGTGGC